MADWLLIQNDGLIETESLYLMGASTKRNDETKIGYFGTGVKHSIAVLLRMQIPFRIFIGEQEVHIRTRPTRIREVDFDIIQINGQDTSLTTQMAPQWEPWYIIREIYSNAIDEGNPVITETDHVDSSAERTRYYIRITDVIKAVLDKWDRYFCFDRTDLLFTTDDNSYPLKVYPNLDTSRDLLVYRKGILVSERKMKAAYSYDMENAPIDEMRIMRDTWNLRSCITVAWYKCPHIYMVEDLLLAIDNRIRRTEELSEEYIEEEVNWHSYDYYMDTDVWKAAIRDRIIINKHVCGMFQEEQKMNSLILPTELCKAIADRMPAIPVYGVANAEGIVYTETEVTKRENYKLQKALEALRELDILIAHPVKIVKFINASQQGMAKSGFIYISDLLVQEKSMRDIALVLLEEQTHLDRGLQDQSRDMQNFLFNQWLLERELRFDRYIF